MSYIYSQFHNSWPNSSNFLYIYNGRQMLKATNAELHALLTYQSEMTASASANWKLYKHTLDSKLWGIQLKLGPQPKSKFEESRIQEQRFPETGGTLSAKVYIWIWPGPWGQQASPYTPDASAERKSVGSDCGGGIHDCCMGRIYPANAAGLSSHHASMWWLLAVQISCNHLQILFGGKLPLGCWSLTACEQ